VVGALVVGAFVVGVVVVGAFVVEVGSVVIDIVVEGNVVDIVVDVQLTQAAKLNSTSGVSSLLVSVTESSGQQAPAVHDVSVHDSPFNERLDVFGTTVALVASVSDQQPFNCR
jgi:hypothetical protein